MKQMRKSVLALTGWSAVVVSLFFLLTAISAYSGSAHAEEKAAIVIGLDAAISDSLSQSGEAIKRGALLAIDEINDAGGVLGRKLELVEKDNRGIPQRGIDNIEEFSKLDNLVAVLGGMYTPVALAQLKAIHKHRMIYLGPWAAGTPIVDNGYEPNYVFRVSARDEFAGGYLIDKALERGFRRPGLLLWRTGWGRSNKKAMRAAMDRRNITPAGVQWFNTSQRDISSQINQLITAGADVIILVANASEGLTIFRNMAALPRDKRIPVISHWGITGGNIVKKDPKVFESLDLSFLQTFSFFQPPAPEKASAVVKAYCARFGGCGSVAEIFSPVGTAHAYDLVHLLKRAIEAAGTHERDKVRAAFEGLGRYEGLVRVYDPPFSPKRHDALDASDFRLCRYNASGAIIPEGQVATE